MKLLRMSETCDSLVSSNCELEHFRSPSLLAMFMSTKTESNLHSNITITIYGNMYPFSPNLAQAKCI